MSTAKHTLTDGSKGKLAFEEEVREQRERSIAVTRCLRCRASFRGTVAEGREWHRAHRVERHPELAPAPTVGRRSAHQRERAIRASEWKRELWGDS